MEAMLSEKPVVKVSGTISRSGAVPRGAKASSTMRRLAAGCSQAMSCWKNAMLSGCMRIVYRWVLLFPIGVW